MKRLLLFLFVSHQAVAGDVEVINRVKVINNLVAPSRLKPLVIDKPPLAPAPLTMRPFSFSPNVGPLPQKGDDYKSPFTGAIPDTLPGPMIFNNIVTRKSSTTLSYENKVK